MESVKADIAYVKYTPHIWYSFYFYNDPILFFRLVCFLVVVLLLAFFVLLEERLVGPDKGSGLDKEPH